MAKGNPNPNQATRFKKGQSGNPSGRSPAKTTLTEILRELGEIEDVKHNGEMLSRKVALGHKMWAVALQGRTDQMRYMYDRLDGKPVQEVKVQSNVQIDAPIILHVGAKIEVVDDDDDSDDDTE
jgi:hypothetical protein